MHPRNRIIDHRKVRAGDLVPHELNPRTHNDTQRNALRSLYEEIGFARSLLAYEVQTDAGPKLKLIDGHLRQSLDPDMQVDVEILDVTDAEARALLLVIDPLAQLAGYDADTLDHLRQVTEGDSAAVASLWRALTEADAALSHAQKKAKEKEQELQDQLPEQFLIIIECKNEREQVELLRTLRRGGQTDLGHGVKCQAKIG